MLEKPDLQDEKIIACLQAEYGLPVVQVTFLPLGADRNTAVYRVVADDNTPYFLKLRGGVFDETCVALPRFLSDQGIVLIIPPWPTKQGSSGPTWTPSRRFFTRLRKEYKSESLPSGGYVRTST